MKYIITLISILLIPSLLFTQQNVSCTIANSEITYSDGSAYLELDILINSATQADNFLLGSGQL